MVMSVTPYRYSSRGGGGYSAKVLGTESDNLIGYWIMDELSGTNSDNAEGTAARDGTYTGVSLNNSTGPDGSPVGFWDGANDYNNYYSASLNTAFNGATGTIAIWCKVSAAGVWTDGIYRSMAYLKVDIDNRLRIFKWSDNEIYWVYTAGATIDTVQLVATPTDWFHVALTWDKPVANEIRAYYNGSQTGAAQGGLAVWAGNLSATECVVGAANNTPDNVWNGYLSHYAIWSKVLTAAQIADLYDV